MCVWIRNNTNTYVNRQVNSISMHTLIMSQPHVTQAMTLHFNSYVKTWFYVLWQQNPQTSHRARKQNKLLIKNIQTGSWQISGFWLALVTSSPGRTTFIQIWLFEHLLRFNHIYSSTTNNNNNTHDICVAIKWTNHSCPSLQVGGS